MSAAALAVTAAAVAVALIERRRRQRARRGAYRLIIAFAPAACRQHREG